MHWKRDLGLQMADTIILSFSCFSIMEDIPKSKIIVLFNVKCCDKVLKKKNGISRKATYLQSFDQFCECKKALNMAYNTSVVKEQLFSSFKNICGNTTYNTR